MLNQKLLFRLIWTDSVDLMMHEVQEASKSLNLNIPTAKSDHLQTVLKIKQEKALNSKIYSKPYEVIFRWITKNGKDFVKI